MALWFCVLGWAAAQAGASVLTEKVNTIEGKEVKLSDYRGKLYLIVNTASKCGFTKQYKGLERLYKKYHERGLVVAGFPCNQFGGQEPGDESTIAEFCETRYKISFPMFSKIEVKGDAAHPIFKELTGENSPFPGKVKWNFNKFLVAADGTLLARFGSNTDPESEDITELLEKHLAK